jgi:uncharacterized membrane protein YkoI
MPVSRIIPILLLIGLLAVQAFAAPASAAEPAGVCLDKAEQRAMVASRKAIPLALAIKSQREKGVRAEVVRAKLCRGGAGLVYLLVLLDRNGKVTRATIDATNGAIMNAR